MDNMKVYFLIPSKTITDILLIRKFFRKIVLWQSEILIIRFTFSVVFFPLRLLKSLQMVNVSQLARGPIKVRDLI